MPRCALWCSAAAAASLAAPAALWLWGRPRPTAPSSHPARSAARSSTQSSQTAPLPAARWRGAESVASSKPLPSGVEARDARASPTPVKSESLPRRAPTPTSLPRRASANVSTTSRANATQQGVAPGAEHDGPPGRPRGPTIHFFSYGPPRSRIVGSVLLLTALTYQKQKKKRRDDNTHPGSTLEDCPGHGCPALEPVLQNRHCYASLHGYDVAIDLTPYTMNLTMQLCAPTGSCRNMDPVRRNQSDGQRAACPRGGCTGPMPAHWVKVAAVRRWLPFYDRLLWLDDDAWLVTMMPLDAIVGAMGPATLLVPQEHPYMTYIFSNYFFFIRNNAEGRRIVNVWWEEGTGPGCRYRRSAFDDGVDLSIDNAWMWHAVLRVRWPRGTPTACSDPCMQQTSLRNCFVESYRAVSRELFGSNLTLRKTTPGLLLRRAADRGGEHLCVFGNWQFLGLQCNWGEGKKTAPEMVMRAFVVHAKPRTAVYKRALSGCVLADGFRERCTGGGRAIRCRGADPDRWLPQWRRGLRECAARAPQSAV